jgi:hypothetical protein
MIPSYKTTFSFQNSTFGRALCNHAVFEVIFLLEQQLLLAKTLYTQANTAIRTFECIRSLFQVRSSMMKRPLWLPSNGSNRRLYGQLTFSKVLSANADHLFLLSN